ncbi:hypothetical protein LCGC14_1590950 [marine sediment metagenome]|uniref:DNA methylase N-4/N-6 domain-containing protein n=1 Tax=marine sediment metagenome TaxID=412755 RepID=A0A0F9J088_9ZZZZ
MAKNVKEIRHLNRQIPPLAHTSMYVWHKYWSRKTWNVVAEYIKTYSKERDIILDPFVGSGITAMEALKNNRRVIVSDLNPIATEITRLTITPISEMKLFDAFKRVEKKVKDRINKLYLTRCRNCGEKFPLTCAIWEKNKCIEIRYKKCPKCDNSCRSKCSLDKHDKALLNKINKSRITSFYPTNKFYYSDGRPFMKKEQYESVDELFTKRNLQALAWLMEAINEEKSKLLRDFLKIGFSSMVHLCSNMNPISEGGHFTPFSSAWIQHSYWYPSGPHMEQNVWDKFDSAINGHQGLLKAKIESNKWFGDIRFAKNIEDVIHNKADIYIYNGSCLDLMSKLPDNSIDFIFTDPPYDSSIQYGELSYMWVSWLNAKDMFVDYLSSNEIINNKN